MSAGDLVWRVLSVDDDPAFQDALEFALSQVVILERPLELVRANSMRAAARLLAGDRDFAVILADVVLETAEAGLHLAKGIREMLGLVEPRIVLLTGQPGFASIEEVMSTYDLSDYCLKTELADRGIKNVLTAAIRSYAQLTAISAARKGLHLILEASNRFSAARSIKDLAGATLAEAAKLLGIEADGLVCLHPDHEGLAPTVQVVGAAGRFAPLLGQSLARLTESGTRALVLDALAQHRSLETDTAQVLYFPREHAVSAYAVYFSTGRPIDDAKRELLKIFAANASKAFGNVALIDRLGRMAFEDEMFGIPNRSALLREIERQRTRQLGATAQHLVLVDVDNFGGLNDAFGVALGNHILRTLVPLLTGAFPPPAMIARVTADLFAVLGPADSVDMQRALALFAQPLRVDGQTLRLTACATQIALDAVPGDAAELLSAAWGTLRSAKSQGPGHMAEYDREVERTAGKRFAMMSRLGHDIERDALSLVYQPQIDLTSGRLIGVEALLRWQGEHGPVPPSEFIPIAEQSSYIHPIGEIVLRHATNAMIRLKASTLDQIAMSINISARQFEDPALIETILARVDAAGIARRQMVLEVTETSALANFADVSQVLQRARDAGCLVSIDDFGTGFSSLAYIHRLPADHLKIDRAFVSRLEEDARSRQIAHVIIQLGKAIGASLIAEGVETEAQADWLREHGCEYAQGWLFGRPMSLDALLAEYGSPAPT